MVPVASFLRRPRGVAGCLALGAVVVGALVANGCLVDIPPLDPDAGIGSGGGSGNVGGGGAGGGVSGGGSGGQGGTVVGGGGGTNGGDCGPQRKRCPGSNDCVAAVPENGCGAADCQPCQRTGDPESVAGLTCSDEGQCALLACAAGYGNCDADVSNGCEEHFGDVELNDASPLVVRFGTKNVDGDRSDWAGVPMYALTEVCSGCDSTEDGPGGGNIVAPSSVPAPNDLAAYFRIAWDDGNFFVLADVFDDHVYQGPRSNPPKNEDSLREDNVSLFFDALDNRAMSNNYGDDDNRVFAGLSTASHAFNRPFQDAQGQREVASQKTGSLCYRIEARVTWMYIVGSAAGSRPDKFPPEPGHTYGFDISINDWDPDPSDLQQFQRQQQVFWVNPNTEYSFRTTGFGGIQLGERN
jgi:hypothetical protein